jgi:hypothetical protein
MAFLAGVLWALLWWPVGRQFGWWAGAGAAVAGGFAGLMLGWILSEWLNFVRPDTGRVRTILEAAGVLFASVAFAALPLWTLSLVRAS